MIKAVIFDMDGLLIDSEPFWQQVNIDRLTKLGVPRQDLESPEYKGLGAKEYFTHWYTSYSWGDTPTPEQLIVECTDSVVRLVREKGEALPGAIIAIKSVKSKGVPVAIASSSALNLIEATINKLNLTEYVDFYHSGTSEDFGKPNPAIFIHTANEMGVNYKDCVVIEDSLNGVIAAKAARMKCIAVPEPKDQNDKRFSIADKVLNSLEKFDINILDNL